MKMKDDSVLQLIVMHISQDIMTVSPGALIAHYGSDGPAGTEELMTVVSIM